MATELEQLIKNNFGKYGLFRDENSLKVFVAQITKFPFHVRHFGHDVMIPRGPKSKLEEKLPALSRKKFQAIADLVQSAPFLSDDLKVLFDLEASIVLAADAGEKISAENSRQIQVFKKIFGPRIGWSGYIEEVIQFIAEGRWVGVLGKYREFVMGPLDGMRPYGDPKELVNLEAIEILIRALYDAASPQFSAPDWRSRGSSRELFYNEVATFLTKLFELHYRKKVKFKSAFIKSRIKKERSRKRVSASLKGIKFKVQ